MPLSPLDLAYIADYPDSFGQWFTQGEWKPYRWLQHCSAHLAYMVENGGGRAIYNAPPRHGKTTFFANIVPAWYLYHYPDRKIFYASNTAERARDEGRNAREMCERAGITLMEDTTAKGRWRTKEGGGMFCVGVGGKTQGWGGHLIILDDLYGLESDAQSPLYRDKVIKWFLGSIFNRQEQPSTIIHPTTRWHRKDLVGWLRKEHGLPWDLLTFPAIAGQNDILGREVGEPLEPDRVPMTVLQDLRRGMLAEMWDAIYQQSPAESSDSNVYRNFTDANVDADIKIVPHLPLDLSIDFNVNPGMHIEIGQHDPMRDITWVRHEVHGPRLALDGAMDRALAIVKGMNGTCPKKIRVFGDASGNSSEIGDGKPLYDKVRAKLDRCGVPYSIHVPRANPPVLERVSRVNDALRDIDGVRRLFVHPDCVRLIYDFEEMQADTDGLPDKSDQSVSHASDALGYMLCSVRTAKLLGRLTPGRMVTGRMVR